MRRVSPLRSLSLASACLLVGCVAFPRSALDMTRGTAHGDPRDSDSPWLLGIASEQTGASPSGSPAGAVGERTAAIQLHVVWPAFEVHLIPISARRIEVKVVAGGKTVGTTVIERPAATGRIDYLPAGTVTVSAEALAPTYQGSGTVWTAVASGSSQVSLQADKLNDVRLTLSPVNAPRIDEFNPKWGAAGTLVTVKGARLPASSTTATYSVRVGTTDVPAARINRYDGSRLTFQLPAEADTGPIAVSFDGVTARSTDSFVVIGGIQVSPSSASLAQGESANFAATVLGKSSQPLAGIDVEWDLDGVSVPVGTDSFKWVLLGSFSATRSTTGASGTVQTAVTATSEATGSGEIGARVSGTSMRGTASFEVR